MVDELSVVRNETGGALWIGDVGEEGWRVRRLVGDDETVDLPRHLAGRLAEQPGWETVGDFAAAKKTAKVKSAAAGEEE